MAKAALQGMDMLVGLALLSASLIAFAAWFSGAYGSVASHNLGSSSLLEGDAGMQEAIYLYQYGGALPYGFAMARLPRNSAAQHGRIVVVNGSIYEVMQV